MIFYRNSLDSFRKIKYTNGNRGYFIIKGEVDIWEEMYFLRKVIF